MSEPMLRFGSSAGAMREWLSTIREIVASPEVTTVCDVGGGANPILDLEVIRDLGLHYTVLDVSEEELAKAPDGYEKVRADITSDTAPGGFDLVITHSVAEHVASARAFHTNVRRMLAASGRATHFFPTLYAPPFLLNKVMPESLAEALLHRLREGRASEGNQGKFEAHYHWCRGPSIRQIMRFESTGFAVEEYVGFFGHAPYYETVPGLQRAHAKLSEWLVAHPLPQATSYAYVTLRRAELGSQALPSTWAIEAEARLR